MNPIVVLFLVTACQCANAAWCLLSHKNEFVTSFAVGGAILLLLLSVHACRR